MKCPVCVNNHVELLRRTNSDSTHGQSSQVWLKYLCHNCHFVWVVHFLYGRKEIIALLDDGGKIRAIRMYRIATGEGLMESKKHIDKIEHEMKNLYTTTEEGLSFSEENIS